MKKFSYSFYLLIFVSSFLATTTVSAHIGYTGRNLGTWSESGGIWSVTGNSGVMFNGSVAITLTNISSDFGWADATDADYGDSHKGRWFSFTLNNPGTFSLSIDGGGTDSGTQMGVYPFNSVLGPRFLPGFTIYRGLAVAGAHDASAVSLAWRATRGAGSEGALNTLGTFSIGNDSNQIGELQYVGHAVDGTSANFGSASGIQGDGVADGVVNGTFALGADSYSVFVGGANYAGVDAGNYGAVVTFFSVPEPSVFLLSAGSLALLAFLSLRRKKNNPEAFGVNVGGFTLIELLVSLSIICILAVLGLPISRAVLEKGNATKCLGNLRNIGQAAMAYAADNSLKLPMTSHKGTLNQWAVTLQPYAADSLKFRCPSDPAKSRERSFAINDMLTPNPCQAEFLDFSYLSKIERPAETIYFGESAKDFLTDHFHFSEFYGDQIPVEVFQEFIDVKRHGSHANYLFADGHAEQLSLEQVKKRLENPKDRLTDPTK